MYHRKLTDQQRELIGPLRESGLTILEIARRFGCSEGAVKFYCLVNGIDAPKNLVKPLRPIPTKTVCYTRSDGHVIRRFTASEDKRLLELEAEGLSYGAIGRALGRNRNVVVSRLACLARRDERAEENRIMPPKLINTYTSRLVKL
jgi:hypothetical protein